MNPGFSNNVIDTEMSASGSYDNIKELNLMKDRNQLHHQIYIIFQQKAQINKLQKTLICHLQEELWEVISVSN